MMYMMYISSVTGNWEYITSNFIRYLEVDLTTNGTLPKWCYEVTFVRSADCSNSTLSSLAKFEVYPLTLFTSSSRTDIFIEACGMYMNHTNENRIITCLHSKHWIAPCVFVVKNCLYI